MVWLLLRLEAAVKKFSLFFFFFYIEASTSARVIKNGSSVILAERHAADKLSAFWSNSIGQSSWTDSTIGGAKVETEARIGAGVAWL